MSAKVSKTKAVTTPYEPKPREKAAIDAYHARRARKSPSPDLKITKGQEQVRVEPDHPDNATGSRLLMNALGTTSPAFYEGLIGQLVNASGKGQEPDEGAVNFSLSVIKSIQPQDEIEAMLAAQMAAVHMASMSFARRLAHVDTIPQQDSAEKAFNKLTRTFTTQMEALKRYRTGGQQKVTVEHVTVQAGGQAIVGSVSHPGGGSSLKNGASTS